jgi:dTDP-N-acetylfucosamine:lipid II N-acetylfucosaminyltransferase
MNAHGKVLHVCHLEKFIPPFINFVEKHFDNFLTRHLFFISGDIQHFPYRSRDNIVQAKRGKKAQLIHLAKLVRAMQQAEKIILHGLFNSHVICILAFMPWVHHKCYWCIWGNDLYTYELGKRTWRWRIREVFRRQLIKRVGHLITHVKGDYDLAKEWYGAKGEWHECFIYPSNLYHEPPVQNTHHEGINILVGNSATPTNNHKEVLDKLQAYVQEDIKIYCPLSYGDPKYADDIASYGKSIFGDKFIALHDFLPWNEYFQFLATIDIAIFNHNRQQGMGNITTLLGLGKKVYIRKEISSWHTLDGLGIKVYDVQNINLDQIDSTTKTTNTLKLINHFSREKLAKDLESIFFG